jgi:hypothetical protein
MKLGLIITNGDGIMGDIKSDELEFIEELKLRFGAVKENEHPSEEDLRFLRERDKLEQEVKGSFEKYVQNYQLLKVYGLETKLINELEWFIVFRLEHNREEFLESLFYTQFKDHGVVKRAFLEYERRKQL